MNKKLIEYNIHHQQEEKNEAKKTFIDQLKDDPDTQKMAFLEIQTQTLSTQETQPFHALYLDSENTDITLKILMMLTFIKLIIMLLLLIKLRLKLQVLGGIGFLGLLQTSNKNL